MEITMQISRTHVAVLAIAAVLGLGFGLGVSSDAQAAGPSCVGVCTIEYQDCLAVPPPYGNIGFCRPRYLQCIRSCRQ
jgi:hypothetical protein